MGLLSSFRPPPKELLALANTNLESAHKETNPMEALKLTKKAKAKIQKAEKYFLASTIEDSSLEEGIANAYHKHGELLDNLGESNLAQESHIKAKKWGYTHKVSEHTLSSQSSDKNDSSSQSISNLEYLSTISSPVTPNHQFSGQNMVPPLSDTIVQETTSPEAKQAISTKSRYIGHIPSNIFNQNVAPPATATAKYALPEIVGRVTSAQQLVYCLGMLVSEDLESDERDWVQKMTQNPEEIERLKDMTTDLIRAFVQDVLKNKAEVDEVVWLAPVLNQHDYRKLLKFIISDINQSPILESDMVDGLVRLLRNSGPRTIDADDLVQILDLLSSKLKITHQQSNQHIYKLTLAVSAVLDSMADNKVIGLNREQLHQPLFKYFECLQDSPEPYLMYQAAYTFQALQYVPNDESQFQAVQRTGVTLLQGVIGVATGVKGIDVVRVIEGLKKIHETTTGIVKPAIFNIKANIESGQSLMSNLKDGFNCKREWYPALRAIDISLQGGRLLEVKQLVDQVPCYREPAFQLGLCQRLGELAINSLWGMESRQDAMDLLAEIYKNDAEWDEHDAVKVWILQILDQLKGSSDRDVSEIAQTILQSLQLDGNPKKQSIYLKYEKESSSLVSLTIARPPKSTNTSRLFNQVHSKQGLTSTLAKLRAERLKKGREELYISPMARRNLNAKDKDIFDLKSDLQEFLASSKKVFLLQGDSGSGKSTFNRAFEMDLWENYNKMEKRIPLFIHLPSIENPAKDLIFKRLRDLRYTEEHIEELRQDYEFILICDGYDETQLTTNLYTSNLLNQEDGWRAQMVISCRTEYNGVDYRDWFQPIDRNNVGVSKQFQEAVIAPFNKDQIQDYIKQYVSGNKSKDVIETPWGSEDYEQALLQIPTLQDLVKNPFLLKMAMEVLPRLVDLKKGDFKSQKVTRIALYDEFVKLWLARNKIRLEELKPKMNKEDVEVFDNLCEEGFTEQGIEYIRELAKAIYIENEGNPVFIHPNKKGQKPWQASFFNKKDGSHFLQQSIPLIRSEKQYQFMHKSILEYGLTLSVFDQIVEKQGQDSTSTLSHSPCTSYVRGLEMKSRVDNLDISMQQSLMDTPFAKRSFVNEPTILQFLVERVQQQPFVFKKLIAAIELSKTNSEASIAAANAITILNHAGFRFNRADLRDIKIPGADLSSGGFDSAHFGGANLKGANLRNIWLSQANLKGAQMDGVQFGELPFLQEDDRVNCCTYSQDGSRFAAGLDDGTINLYETSNWYRTKALARCKEGVITLSLSSSNNQVASGGRGSIVRLWDIDTGECIHTLQGHSDDVTSVVYSPEGDRIASGSHDETVRLWDVDTGECIHILQGHIRSVTSVVYSPKGNRIASGSHDETVRLWDVDTGECIHILKGHSSSVKSVAYSPKGDQVASGGWDNTVRLWDVDAGKCIRILKGHSENITSVVYSPEGDRIASGSRDNTVQLWDVDSGECIHTLQGHSDFVNCVVYSPKGDRIASGSWDKTVRLWDVDTGECAHALQGHSWSVMNAVYSPEGDRVASGSVDKTVRLWDVDTGECIHILKGHSQDVNSVVYSPKGDQIASGSHDSTVRLWDVDTGECVHVLQGHIWSVTSVVYSPKGDRIASGSSDTTVRLWDVDTGECIHILQGHDWGVISVVYSPKGDRIASGSDDSTVRLWDVDTGECIHTLKGHSSNVKSVAYSPKGDQVASGSSDSTVRLWDVDTGECIHILQGHSWNVTSVMYSSKRDRIASGSDDKTVRLWDLDTGECVHILQDHSGRITSVVYSQNGDWIASGSGDRTVRLWNTETSQCETIISDFNGDVNSLALRSDSGSLFLVTGCGDKSVRHWTITKKEDEYKSTLCWSSSHEALVVTDASFKDVRGLSPSNRKLLTQRNALVSAAPLTEIQAVEICEPHLA